MWRHILTSLGICCLVVLEAPHAGAQPQDTKVTRKTEPVQIKDGPKLPLPSGMSCIQVNSSGSYACQDQGGYASTCAKATCPSGHTLTGGGGACAAGDRKVKSLFPRVDRGDFTIVCEQQGVEPQANAICCKLN